MTTPSFKHSKGQKKELVLVYIATLLVTGGMALAQGSIGWLRGYLVVAAAAVFIFLPMELLYRQGIDPQTLGIRWDGIARSLRHVIFVSLLVFPIYLVGFHVWQTQWLNAELNIDDAKFDHWPMDVQDAPKLKKPDTGEVWVYAYRDTFWVRWALNQDQTFSAHVSGHGKLKPKVGRATVLDGQLNYERKGSGHLRFEAEGSKIKIELKADGKTIPPNQIRLGTALNAAEKNPLHLDRSLWWFINLVLVQLLLVALPEELFYRGYFQSKLDGLIGRDVKVLGVYCNPTSIILTSALFAIGHIITVPSPQRLAVFFPSLLFGWMRRATGSILAPLIFHAACNLIVTAASQFYSLG